MAGNEFQMSSNNENLLENLKKSYLAAYQTLQFSKTNKPDAEVADIERRCLFTKYMINKNNINEDIAGTLLQSELENYSTLIDSQNHLNNYWNQFSSLNVNTENNPVEWKSNLTDLNVALQYLEPLTCNTKTTSSCQNKEYIDRDVEKLIDLWKNVGSSPRARKIPRQESNIPLNKKIIENENKEDKLKSNDFQSIRKPLPITKTETETATNTRQYSTANIKKHFPITERGTETATNTKQYSNSERININKSNVSKNEQCLIDKRDEKSEEKKFSGFKTARTVLGIQQAKKNSRQPPINSRQQLVNTRQQPIKKSLGGRALNSPFVCPFKDDQPKEEEEELPEPTDPRLKNIEPKMIELIKNEIMDNGTPISWDDIAGLEHAKRIIKEIVVFPMLRPDIFTGLRRPPKGILLFGPPGTGKTLIGKCIASQSKSTFFSISASSLTSKWVGEGEKMVRALFAVAQVEQPSVVFIDEIDSLLSQRSETEHESSRRMKTEFLIQLDGAATGDEDRILVIGATNRPYELDEAARRRLVKRLYVPLPELEARAQIVRNLLKSERHDLTDEDIYEIAKLADGYSGADMTNLCKDASMGPIRSISFDELEGISKEDVRRVTLNDFKEALDSIRPSVSQKDLLVYIDWDRTYGTASAHARK